MFAFRIAGGAGAVAVRSICSIRACVCVFQRDCKASYRTRNVSIARASPRISASAKSSLARCRSLESSLSILPIKSPISFPCDECTGLVHSLLVAGLMVNASHEDMESTLNFARTRAAHPTVAPYFATSEGRIGLGRLAGLFWTLRLGAEKPNTRFTDGVSSYSDFRAISDISMRGGKAFQDCSACV